MSVEQATVCVIELSDAQEHAIPFGGALMTRTTLETEGVITARTIIPTVHGNKATPKQTVDRKGNVDTDWDSEPILDTEND